ncbi:Hypothetical protein AJAP_38405 [Amycolatopsis japonica]|uniref:Secreted protein n=2 Tax=Amycolatopsis japonica TaxID=208439 RepID=A0A075V1U8_9PSEU|nr:Hypothetical protein AJAP_38405 [Amycolatopsis japonica]
MRKGIAMNMGTHQAHHAHHGHGGAAVEGLQIAKDGYVLVPETLRLTAGEEVDYRFRILGKDGVPLTAFAETHEKKIHLIVARRDLTGFWHLHPAELGDGVWTVRLHLPEAGEYRVFADFWPDGAEKGLTLGADLAVAGAYEPRPVPLPADVFEIDGYEVGIKGELRPEETNQLVLAVHRDGEPVTDLQPYLGAYGHLVTLRLGDLAYVHVHPDGAPGDGETQPGPEIAFQAHVPGPGTYRLFLDFKHEDVVRTAQFTLVAE